MLTLHSILRRFMANPLLRFALGMGCALGILLVARAISDANPGIDAQAAPQSGPPGGVCCPQFTTVPTITPTATSTDTPGTLPDLVIDNFWLHPQNSCFDPIANPLGARLVVRNAGPAKAGPFYVTINGNLLFVGAGLGVGQTITLWAPVANPSNSASVDVTNLVTESNEDNNQISMAFPTATPPPTCTPSPTVSPTITPISGSPPITASVQASASNVQIGQTIIVTANTSLEIPGYDLTVIDMATGQAQDPNNPIITPAEPPPLHGNSGVAWTLTAVRPGMVRFSISVYGEVREGPCVCYHFTTATAESGVLAVTTAGTSPDLVVSSTRIGGNQTCYSQDFDLMLYVTITNNGAGDAGVFVVEANGVRQTASDGLAAGQSASLMFSGYLYGSANTAAADITNLVPESDENNNQRSEQAPLPTPPPLCPAAPPSITYITRLPLIWR